MKEKWKETILHHLSILTLRNQSRYSIVIGEFNHTFLLRDEKIMTIRSGVEQRDIAIKAGYKGAPKLVYKDKFFTLDTCYDVLKDEKIVQDILVERLNPKEGVVTITEYDHNSIITAKITSKAAGPIYIRNHHAHT